MRGFTLERVQAAWQLGSACKFAGIEAVHISKVAVWVQRVHEERLMRQQRPPDLVRREGRRAAVGPEHLDGFEVGEDLQHAHDLLGEARGLVRAGLLELLIRMDADHLHQPVRGPRERRGPGLRRGPPGHEPDQRLHPLRLAADEVVPLLDHSRVEEEPLCRRRRLDAFQKVLAVIEHGADKDPGEQVPSTCTLEPEVHMVPLDLEARCPLVGELVLEHGRQRLEDVRQPARDAARGQLPHEEHDLGVGPRPRRQQALARRAAQDRLLDRQEGRLLDLAADSQEPLHNYLVARPFAEPRGNVFVELVCELDLLESLAPELALAQGLRRARRRGRHRHGVRAQDLAEARVAAAGHHENVGVPSEELCRLAVND
mmetsp:Transcript_77190/g.218443  ORF Transcript_77190/g.218443 Transcript_77190/m.218443 type:complete len:372 (-) Transcript_77190:686-1801(-)